MTIMMLSIARYVGGTVARVKIYESKAWLYRQLVINKLSEKEIAELAGTSQATISRWLTKYELIKKR